MAAPRRNKLAKILGVILIVLVVAAVGFIALIKPKVDSIFANIGNATCVYNIKVIAFADANGDGVQGADEAGVAGVAATLQHSHPMRDFTPEQTLTDESGLATLSADKYCFNNDMLTTTVVPPSGYSATTAVSFGPYPVPLIYVESSETLVAANPIPDVLYVGLKQV
jgi:hypothetical protein